MSDTILLHASGSAGSSRGQNYITATARLDDESKGDPKQDLLREAHERFRIAITADNDWRRRAEEEINFVDHLQHWTQAQLNERQGRPCLTFDRIGPAVDQIINDARQNPPEPRFNAVGGGADKETALILQGLLRNIENDSEAEIAYMTGYEHAVKVGRGWWRVLFDYEDDWQTFWQKIKISEVPNLFSVYADPAATKWDYSDMRYCFITEDLDRRVFQQEWPSSIVASMSDFEGVGDRVKADWFPKGAVRVAEYWYTIPEAAELYQLSSGLIVTADKLYGATPIAKRIARRNRVFSAKISGCDVLEGPTEWPGKWIPIVPCLGRVSIKEGKRTVRGIVRAAMDANLHYDYLRSKEAEAVGLAPIAPWLIVAGQIEGFEWKWADANRKAFPFLEYHRFVDGQEMPPPQRLQPSLDLAGLTGAVAQADNDIKATLATYDASLGAPGPEQSGRAILARQREGDNAHFNYHDNLARAMRHTGRIILDLVPHIYTEQRVIMINDPDGGSKEVQINQPTVAEGVQRIFDVANDDARYHVTIGSGPSYASRRQEGKESVLELVRMIPGPMSRALDIVVKALDIPYGDELAARLIPPDIAAENGEPGVLLTKVQQQLAAMTSLNQHLQGALQKATNDMERERLKYASQERVSANSDITQLIVAALKNNSAEAIAQLQSEIDFLKNREKLLGASPQTANPGDQGEGQQPQEQQPNPVQAAAMQPPPSAAPALPPAPPQQ